MPPTLNVLLHHYKSCFQWSAADQAVDSVQSLDTCYPGAFATVFTNML